MPLGDRPEHTDWSCDGHGYTSSCSTAWSKSFNKQSITTPRNAAATVLVIWSEVYAMSQVSNGFANRRFGR